MTNDVDSHVVVHINEYIGLNFNTTSKRCLMEMFLGYQPHPQPLLYIAENWLTM